MKRHRRVTRVGVCSIAIALILSSTSVVPLQAVSTTANGTTILVSVATEGELGDARSFAPDISENGRLIAFVSDATTLIGDDANAASDIFVHDYVDGVTERVSIGVGGEDADGGSEWPAISGDGRYVAFVSDATNLLTEDQTDDQWDLFRYDRQEGDTVQVNVTPGPDSEPSSGPVWSKSCVSRDGRFVVFASEADDLVAGDPGAQLDVFVRDMVENETQRIPSPLEDELDGEAWEVSTWPSAISGDGRYVVFGSNAFNEETVAFVDSRVYVHDRTSGETECVSVNSSGQLANNPSLDGDVSDDGRYVSFHSSADNLSEGDTNETGDVFLHDRETDETICVSVSLGGAAGDGRSDDQAISGDGRWIAFESYATNLIDNDDNVKRDCFLYERLTGNIVRVSVSSTGEEGNDHSNMALFGPAIDLDGTHVTFGSYATNLVEGDDNGYYDVFLHYREGAGENEPPVATDDTYVAAMNNPLTVPAMGVLYNDTDADGDTLSAVKVADPAHGTVDLASDGEFIYTPEADFTGEDSFTYKANDGRADSNVATVNITVREGNTAPVAVDDAYTVNAGASLSVPAPGILANDTDAENDRLWSLLETDVSHGTLVPDSDGHFTYTPDSGFLGDDTYTYRATDGMGSSEPATVTITVRECVFELVELQGPDRYATAIDISRYAYPDGLSDESTKTVVLARGERFPDALAGSSIAGLVDGPILLTRTTRLLPEIAAEIERLGAERVIMLGDQNALTADVESAVKALPGVEEVLRFGGLTRYDTAAKIAEWVIPELGEDFGGAAFVATGAKFPDSLAASPVIGAQGMPLFLAHPTQGLSEDTLEAMAGVESAIILGGDLAVTDAVQTKLEDLLGADKVSRVEGVDRYQTAVKVAEFAVGLGHTWDMAGIASGVRFPDSITGGALQTKSRSVVLLTRLGSLNEYTQTALEANKDTICEVRVFGGPLAIEQQVRDAINAIFE